MITDKGCSHAKTVIWEPHLAGARKCLGCGMVYNPNMTPQWHFEPPSLEEQLTLEREICGVLREALKECRLSAENHTGINSKSVIMRVYDTSREALGREQEMRGSK